MNILYLEKLKSFKEWLSVGSWLFKAHYSNNFFLANNNRIKIGPVG